MRNTITIVALMCAACGANSQNQPVPTTPDPELVTRPSEPMLPRPKRMAAVRSEVTETELNSLRERMMQEAPSSELIVATALDWSDGRRTIVATHTRRPSVDMSEEQLEAAVDEDALHRCRENYPACVDPDDDRCDQEPYEECIRMSYGDRFVYASSHLGRECAVYELSVYEFAATQPTLEDRETLDSMACEFDVMAQEPSAEDIDGDGGPELVYAWVSIPLTPVDEGALHQETIAIIDANELHVQYQHRGQVDSGPDQEDRIVVTTIDLLDVDGDGFDDVVQRRIEAVGYCPQVGWALGPRLVVPRVERPGGEFDEPRLEPCETTVTGTIAKYDPTEDVWRTPEAPGEDE